MLRITRRVDYAVQVMIAIAKVSDGTKISTPAIGEQTRVPQSFLVKVIGDLRRSGLIATSPGRYGGITLAMPAESITLRHIVEAMEGPIILNTCSLRPEECPKDEFCVTHGIWKNIENKLHAELDAVSLDYLLTEKQKLRSITGQ